MKFQTAVELPKERLSLQPQSRVLLLGSCFAENIGKRMATALPEKHVCVNPFGVLYNPESIRTAMDVLLFGSLFFPDEFLFQGTDGLWHSWLHSSVFSAESRMDCARKIMKAYDEASSLLRRADVICITFGTTHIYEHLEKGIVVGNCHKENTSVFKERAMSADEIVERWGEMIDELQREAPQTKIIFTISPYRYAKYGFHGNQLAKATLLLAVEQLCQRRNVSYFPAYEIVLDELRDYRFYDADMLHPSPQATDYVWERFVEWSFSEEMKSYAAEKEALRKALDHRLLHPESEASKKFLEKLEKQQTAFQKKWGHSI